MLGDLNQGGGVLRMSCRHSRQSFGYSGPNPTSYMLRSVFIKPVDLRLVKAAAESLETFADLVQFRYFGKCFDQTKNSRREYIDT